MTFLAAEPLIVARLIEACPSARAVLTARDVAEAVRAPEAPETALRRGGRARPLRRGGAATMASV
jgi:hypothetical protein